MKIFKKPDFNPFIFLDQWKALSKLARIAFATQIGSDLKILPHRISTDCVLEFMNADFLISDGSQLKEELRPFRKMMHSMYRHPLFDLHEEELALEYVADHLIHTESATISIDHMYISRKRPVYYAMQTATDPFWLRTFLDVESVETWERQHQAAYSEETYFTPAVHKQLICWIERLLKGKNPIPFSDLLDDVENIDVALMALRAGIRYLFLFPALGFEALDPFIGLFPAVHAQYNRKEVQQPVPSDLPKGVTSYWVPFLLQDMTALLVATTGEGLRLKADLKLFKKECALLEHRLVSLPLLEKEKDDRIAQASDWLFELEFVSVKKGKKERFLKPTEAGMQWIALSESDQLQRLLDFLRKKHAQNKEGEYLYYKTFSFLRKNPQDYTEKGETNIAECVIRSFSICPVGKWFNRNAFLMWQRQSKNPFFSTQDSAISRIFQYWDQSEEARDELWETVIKSFFDDRLLPLGAIRYAMDSEGELLFSLTSSGAYLLGFSDVFEYQSQEVEGDIIIQPNFEVVFTVKNPLAEAELMRYAHRIGYNIGTLFRITQASIIQGLNSGLEYPQIIESLQLLCSKKIPNNIVAQITDWGKSFRRVSIKKVTIIRCPDSDTALRVQALAPKKLTLISDTVLQLSDAKVLTPLKKKLREIGVGIEL